MVRFSVLFIIISLFTISCKTDPKKKEATPKVEQPAKKEITPTVEPQNIETKQTEKSEPETKAVEIEKENTQFRELTKSEHGIAVDLRYATTNNFTKKQIYDCGRCYLRPEAAEALVKVHQELKSKNGYGLKVFDCFRPRPYQQRLWDIVPNPDYVTPPNKGSMHSRGLAVDLTIVDDKGKELDMGTAFDFFGKEAHTDYTGHTEVVNANRKLLTETMKKFGFNGIRTEWWHFSFNAKYELDEWVWPCSIKK